jgi:hypothetical protein
MATAETWVTSGAYTNPMAMITVVGAAVIVLGRLVGGLAMAAAGAAVATRVAITRAGAAALPAYPAVPMAVVVDLTAAGGITKVDSVGANHDVRH